MANEHLGAPHREVLPCAPPGGFTMTARRPTQCTSPRTVRPLQLLEDGGRRPTRVRQRPVAPRVPDRRAADCCATRSFSCPPDATRQCTSADRIAPRTCRRGTSGSNPPGGRECSPRGPGTMRSRRRRPRYSVAGQRPGPSTVITWTWFCVYCTSKSRARFVSFGLMHRQ